jgi:hypothetical protein
MRKGRIHALAVIGVTIVAAALVALNTTGPSTAGSAPTAAASHAVQASADAEHREGVPYSIHRGLVKDCVRIELGDLGWNIWDNGADSKVTIVDGLGSCWNVVNSFGIKLDGHHYSGYEYQDLRGDCLYDNAGSIVTVTGPCFDLNSYESFFGIKYYANAPTGSGWTVSAVASGPNSYMAASPFCDPGYYVDMEATTYPGCVWWNFPG